MLARMEKERGQGLSEPIPGVLGAGILWLLLTAGQGELTTTLVEPKLVPEEPEARGSAHSLNMHAAQGPSFHQAKGKECEGCRVRDSALRMVSSMEPSPPTVVLLTLASPALAWSLEQSWCKKNWVAQKICSGFSIKILWNICGIN